MSYDDYTPQPEPQPQSDPSKQRTAWLIGCGVAVLVMLCVVGVLVFGGISGIFSIFTGAEPELNVAVTGPNLAVEVGDDFSINISMGNVGTKNLTVTEILLPDTLLAGAELNSVSPEALTVDEAEGNASYSYDLMIAPTGEETIQFNFTARQAGEISGKIEVRVGSSVFTQPINISIIESEVAVATDTSPVTELGEVIPYRSVVQIIALVEVNGQLVEGWTGSGTVVSEDGLILTNAHVILSDRYYEVLDLVVAITTAQDQPPEERFYADVMQADADLDLAVIKVRSDLDGGPANFSTYGIEPVVIGDSDSLSLGDQIVIMGYPGIGGATITLTRGEVSGFTSEAPYGNRAFIKTSATIAGGNSGGLAATPQGELIGVPTQVGSGDIGNMVVDCRPLADTNRDGFVDESDNCVPTGGFINALRPIKLAQPMIEAAVAGEISIDETIDNRAQEEFEPEGDMMFVEDFSDNSNSWNLFEEPEGTASITDGMLVFDVFVEGMVLWSVLPDTYESLVMVADVEVIEPAGDSNFGFVCGFVDSDNFTMLEISEDGYYSIWKYEDDKYVSLVEWTYSDQIAAGGPYLIGAYCGPDGLALALEDTLLAEIVDPNYVPGLVGLTVESWDNPRAKIGFDNFYIMEP